MPEGDTIWRAARSLHAALAGKTVVDFRSPLPAVASAARRLHVVGASVEGVEAHGKHLLVRFAGGAVLHTHQGMKGRWHLSPPGRPTPRRAAPPRAVVVVDGAVASCHGSPVVELLSARQAATHPALSRLGPDLLAAGFDPGMARERLRARRHLEIGVALMDQTALAGVGNVFKSETLFVAGLSPFVAVEELDDTELDRLVAIARDLLLRNRGPGERRTTTSATRGPLWVYGRRGRACRRCGHAVCRARQGEQARSTYFCPTCQGVPVDRARPSAPRT